MQQRPRNTSAARVGAQNPDAMARWHAQEAAPLPPVAGADDHFIDRLPSGWWMLPALVLAIPLWALIIWQVLVA